MGLNSMIPRRTNGSPYRRASGSEQGESTAAQGQARDRVCSKIEEKRTDSAHRWEEVNHRTTHTGVIVCVTTNHSQVYFTGSFHYEIHGIRRHFGPFRFIERAPPRIWVGELERRRWNKMMAYVAQA